MEKKVIVSEKSPAAIGPYSQAIEYNGIVYTSGVIGVNPATGEVGETIEEQTILFISIFYFFAAFLKIKPAYFLNFFFL